MESNKQGIIRGYFRPEVDETGLQRGISALIEAGVASGNLFFEQEGKTEWERLLRLLSPGDRVVVLRLEDICRNIDELFGLVRRLYLLGVVLKSVAEPWFHFTGEAMQDSALYELIGHLYELSGRMKREHAPPSEPERKPVGRPPGICVEYREKLTLALELYAERGDLSVAEICGMVGLNERTFYRYLDQERIIRRPKGRKAKTNART